MKEIITTGKSLESIREKLSLEWSCSPEDLILEVIEKPGIFNRSWKVKVILADKAEEDIPEDTSITWDETKYTIFPGKQVETIVPFPLAGKLFYQENEIRDEYSVRKGDCFEFYPLSKEGGLTWELDVASDGSKAVAIVKHEHSGRYILEEEIPQSAQLFLDRFISWESSPDSNVVQTEEDLKRELAEKGIIYGVRPNLWIDFLTIDGKGEIVLAEYTPPIQTIQPELIDFVGEPVFEEEDDEEKIDFFACKLKVCQKDEILARKVPGKEGTPGIDIFGNALPVEKMKDFVFKLKKNVYLSEDGLEVFASCPGTPLRVNNNTYLVENAYILNKDVDLETGSIDFPGDVNIGRDVKDGLYVYSGGKIQIQGSVSSASLKAETGLIIRRNIIASKIMVGEKNVFRSQLFNGLQEVNDELNQCIAQVEQLQNVSVNSNVGQLLKVLLEKNYQKLPQKTLELESLIGNEKVDCVSQELEVAVRTIKHFLVGAGPLQLKNLLYLKSAFKVIDHFLNTKSDLIPPSVVVCDTHYVQNSEINCAGDFICKKGIYNSTIKVEGNIKIHGVCRGGEINCAGDIYIWELGGSSMSATTLRAAKDSRINVDYCHSNIRIYQGKELVRIEDDAQKLEIYREKGTLQVGKLKWDGKN